MDSANELSRNLYEWGASTVGFSRVYEKLPDKLKKFEFAVTVLVKLSDSITDQIQKSPTYSYFHHYRTVNALIDQITLKGVLFLENKGFGAFPVPASQTVNDAEDRFMGVFPHKTAGVLAGLGWVGKSGLFISNEYGPRVRMGTILTDMEMDIKNDVVSFDCGECRICVDSCPAMALTGKSWSLGMDRRQIVDPKACSDYMNINFKHIGRGSVCGICMKVCPKRFK